MGTGTLRRKPLVTTLVVGVGLLLVCSRGCHGTGSVMLLEATERQEDDAVTPGVIRVVVGLPEAPKAHNVPKGGFETSSSVSSQMKGFGLILP